MLRSPVAVMFTGALTGCALPRISTYAEAPPLAADQPAAVVAILTVKSSSGSSRSSFAIGIESRALVPPAGTVIVDGTGPRSAAVAPVSRTSAPVRKRGVTENVSPPAGAASPRVMSRTARAPSFTLTVGVMP